MPGHPTLGDAHCAKNGCGVCSNDDKQGKCAEKPMWDWINTDDIPLSPEGSEKSDLQAAPHHPHHQQEDHHEEAHAPPSYHHGDGAPQAPSY
jgi:hypothetical protein